MGLLTNPASSTGGLTSLLRRYSQSFAWLLYFFGVAFFLLMVHPEYSHKTYFSENSLLPGLVKGEFDESRAAVRLALAEESNAMISTVELFFCFTCSFLTALKEESQQYPDGLPVPWLMATFHQLGLETYEHNFTLRSPLGDGRAYTGRNVYAILRAPRASSTEALVFSVPYRPPNSLENTNDVGVAVLLACAKFFRKQYYWAKDVIFLVTEHEQLGMQAWLESYHQRSCGSGALEHGDLEARAGAIQAAINLEISTPKITHFNVRVEGLNGQLPNLDLVNLVNRLSYREGLGQMSQGIEEHPNLYGWKGFWRSLHTMLQMASKQASGIPNGNHGLFHRFGIEAVTIEGVLRKRKKRPEADLFIICRAMEGVFRSLNNLLERFHQSFFFYLLPSTNRYISIGMYMPGFGLLGGSLVIAALGLWMKCTTQSEKKEKQATNSDQDAEESESVITLPTVLPPNLSSTLPFLLTAHVVGVVALYLPPLFTNLGLDFFSWDSEDSISLGLCTYSVCLLLLSLKTLPDKTNWQVLKCLLLIELSVLAFTIALCNYSLAMFMTVIYAPVALLSGPAGSWLRRAAKIATILLVHPLSVLLVVCSLDSFVYSGGSISVGTFVTATKRALVFGVVDGYIYGSITFSVASLFLLPCWQLLWCLNVMRPMPATKAKQD